MRIGEMSKAALINEIMESQRAVLLAADVNHLRGLVVRFRADEMHKALIIEAGLDSPQDDQGQGQFL